MGRNGASYSLVTSRGWQIHYLIQAQSWKNGTDPIISLIVIETLYNNIKLIYKKRYIIKITNYVIIIATEVAII